MPELLMVVGPAVLVLGVLLMRKNAAPTPSQVLTRGTVLRWDHRRVGSTVAPRTLGSLPVVSFRTEDGREVEGTPQRAADRGVYRSGHQIEVRYQRDDPSVFLIRQGWLDRPYAFLVLAGGALTFLTLVLPLVFSAL